MINDHSGEFSTLPHPKGGSMKFQDFSNFFNSGGQTVAQPKLTLPNPVNSTSFKKTILVKTCLFGLIFA